MAITTGETPDELKARIAAEIKFEVCELRGTDEGYEENEPLSVRGIGGYAMEELLGGVEVGLGQGFYAEETENIDLTPTQIAAIIFQCLAGEGDA